MSRMADFGNDLYTGKKSFDFVGKAKTWYIVSAVFIIGSIALLGLRGLNFGLEFTGGTEFRVATASAPADFETVATDAVREVAGPSASANVSTLGGSTVRVQTEELSSAETGQVRDALQEAFSVSPDDVDSDLIGPSWGETVSQQALRAMVVFLAVSTVLMALYFRTWKMSIAAMIALAHDMIITAGIYVLSGFEVSPATVIGFLTVLGYSLYDTVIVFDKVRENAEEAFSGRRMTYAHAANLAVNQTLVRSINTSVIAVLPIIAVLVIGFARLGPGTLLDLSLVLFIGMTVGAISSIYIATPLLVWLRRRDEDVLALDRHVAKHEPSSPAEPEGDDRQRGERAPEERDGDREPVAVGAAPTATGSSTDRPAGADDGSEQTVTGRSVHRYARSGPRQQPKRTPKSKRGR